MTYIPPKDIWEMNRLLKFNEPLEENDEKYVRTEKGRGKFSYHSFLKELGVDAKDFTLRSPPESLYLIFCGHRGCGKSTELRKLSKQLDGKDRFFVVYLDATSDLDPNNIEYPDILMALANQLFEKLNQKRVKIDTVFLSNLLSWFDERIEKHSQTKDFAAEVKAGIQAKTGVPFFAELFAKVTNTFKINSTYKDEVRRVIKNSFSQFSDAFNQLIAAAEEAVEKKALGRKILFITDGTDRLSSENSKRFFIDDSNQLQQIKSNFIYCAPIHMIHEGNQVQQFFGHFVLPMIKVTEKGSNKPYEPGYKVLRAMIYKRADESLFDSEETVDYMIQYSGGCPRDFLKLVHYAFKFSEQEIIDKESATKAVKALATDYRRILEEEDFELLHAIDCDPDHDSNTERVRQLLFNLALLEYNSYWRRSHPVIQLLEGYKRQQETTPHHGQKI